MVAAQVHAVLPPSVEVACSADGTADLTTRVLLGVANGPELLEGLGAVDRGLVVASGLEDVVVGSVAVDGTLPLSSGGGVVGAVRLDDVVLDERVASPAVDSEVAVAVGLVCTRVLDHTVGVVMIILQHLEARQALTGCWFQGSIPFHRQGSRYRTIGGCIDLHLGCCSRPYLGCRSTTSRSNYYANPRNWGFQHEQRAA